MEEKTQLRGPLIDNAVKFLQDSSVRSSSVSRQIAFLEGKGLTRPEIEEAMRRTHTAPESLTPPTGADAIPTNSLPLPSTPPPTELLTRGKKAFDWGSLAVILALIGSTGVMLARIPRFSFVLAYLKTWRRRLLADEKVDDLKEDLKKLEESHTQMLRDVRELKSQLLESVDAIKATQNYLYRELGQELEEIREEISIKTTPITTTLDAKQTSSPL